MRACERFPYFDAVYTNRGGGRYERVGNYSEKSGYRGLKDDFDGGYWLKNVLSGWTCYCVGVVQYEDGTIEWSYSKNGHFEK